MSDALLNNRFSNTEKWLPVKDYEDLYKVSNHGKVIDLINNTIVENICSLDGHVIVALTKNSITKPHLLGFIVATMFVHKKSDKAQTIYHKDGNILNNCADNLGWIEDDAPELDNIDDASSQKLIHYIDQIFLSAFKREFDDYYILASENMLWSGIKLLERMGYIFDLTIDHKGMSAPTTYMTGVNHEDEK